jgi:hypothetical protein
MKLCALFASMLSVWLHIWTIAGIAQFEANIANRCRRSRFRRPFAVGRRQQSEII